ncbi:hypothetical protein GCM10011514_50120 [Emticicia aquatilis]|uniref:Uncharacterized protein n=1 Tax=Emticicia aquatilis TaxID=1537369 RepID=A0A916Z7K0_9BACT|nr:hypothetical protein [Emticicia aquatilis]GGD80115.1 hypothetical protein GCM10011514_50120 [Emticicia aquatilis]
MTDHSVLLKERITFLEDRQCREMTILKEQVHTTYESLRPINFLKNSLQEFISQPDLKDSVVDGIAGIATGYVSKKLLVGNSHNPFKKIAGTLFQIAVTTLVVSNSSKIKAMGEVAFKNLFGHETKSKGIDKP